MMIQLHTSSSRSIYIQSQHFRYFLMLNCVKNSTSALNISKSTYINFIFFGNWIFKLWAPRLFKGYHVHDVFSFILQQPIATLVIIGPWKRKRENVNMSTLSKFYSCAKINTSINSIHPPYFFYIPGIP